MSTVAINKIVPFRQDFVLDVTNNPADVVTDEEMEYFDIRQ